MRPCSALWPRRVYGRGGGRDRNVVALVLPIIPAYPSPLHALHMTHDGVAGRDRRGGEGGCRNRTIAAAPSNSTAGSQGSSTPPVRSVGNTVANGQRQRRGTKAAAAAAASASAAASTPTRLIEAVSRVGRSGELFRHPRRHHLRNRRWPTTKARQQRQRRRVPHWPRRSPAPAPDAGESCACRLRRRAFPPLQGPHCRYRCPPPPPFRRLSTTQRRVAARR